MEKNSTLVTKSRYVSGGITEVSSFALEWWERTVFEIDDSDLVYVVEKNFVNRMDLIAKQFLDDSALWWFVAMYNNVLDPLNEVTEGLVLRIPTRDRVKSLLGGRLGGYESTREVPLTNISPII